MGRFDGKVVYITGAARGQGRNHAIRFAKEGADVIAVDLCESLDTIDYPLATEDDLATTVAAVEDCGRRIVARKVDVRDLAGLSATVEEGVGELGRLDFAVANAGVGALSADLPDPVATFRDVVDINLTGVWNTMQSSLTALRDNEDGGAVVLVSSTAGLRGNGGASAGGQAYTASKHAVVGLMRNFAVNYAADGIRVNTIHPTGVATPMIENEVMARLLREAPDMIGATSNLLPIPALQSDDISDAVLWLCSHEAQWITGVTLPVDAGFTAK